MSAQNNAVASPADAFADYLPQLTAALDSLTTDVAALPGKSDLDFQRTMDRSFGKDLDKASQRVLNLTERVLALVDESQRAAAAGAKKGKPVTRRRKLEDEDDVIDGYKGSVLGVVDGLLEDADTQMDELRGIKGKTNIAIKPSILAQAGKKLPGPFSKQVERLPQNIIHAVGLSKPQLLFPDAPDNTRTDIPWAPTLSSKPHAMVPLGAKVKLDYELTAEEEEDPAKAAARLEREQKARHHPYYYETKHLPYPTSMFIPSQPIPPKPFDSTPFMFVDTPEKYQQMVEKLKAAKEIAVDLEHHDMRSYIGFTCLIQISTRDEDFVVDTLSLRKQIRDDKFGDVMTDPSIIKVFHGSDSDVIWLQRDFDIYLVNLFDTYHASFTLNMPQRSLAGLLQLYCNFEADKRYQRADWRIRPLPEDMLHYARSDTHYLLFVYDNLRNALIEKSSRPPSPVAGEESVTLASARPNPQEAIRKVLERSADTALRLYERDTYDVEAGKGTGGWLSAGKKWLPKGGLDEEVGWVWRRMHDWRDGMARELDESPFYIMPQNMLAQVCTQGNPTNLGRIVRPDRAPIAAQYIPNIASIITDAKKEFKAVEAERRRQEKEEMFADGGIVIPEQKADKAHKQQAQAKKKIAVPAVPAVPSAPATAGNMWSFGQQSTPSKPVVKTQAKSGLFGSTIKSTPTFTPSSISSLNKPKPTSGLFGKALPRAPAAQAQPASGPSTSARKQKELSPGFLKVMDDMRVEMAPKQILKRGEEEAGSGTLRPESVPFVPAGQRKAAPASGAVSSSARPAPAPAPQKATPSAAGPASKLSAPAPRDGIVQVKKSKKQPQKKREASVGVDSDGSKKTKLNNGDGASTSTTATPDVSPPGTPAVAPKSEKAKGKKKEKVKPEDIPDFDYSTQPNLLDQPQSASSGADAKKKKKKNVKQAPKPGAFTGVEVPTFGARPARDMSQPKGGNKAGTFTG
ncbi:hypothetical protein I350_00576 [Cryptococcus amylolentus CBS 6273]|uniref:3'-5' exonuclease domain-containing protein n=1 Tax=Cryptococcus amylolentus CBS 6273 TaxID=1296118 RepID=A0A1E3KHJ9_9TREE|nr:hypothetical protein I350_00576 [Cryptococcus amylolentus CBS 6273]